MFRRVIAPLVAMIGGLLVVVGYLFQGRGLESPGLPVWGWQAVGAALFFIFVLVIAAGLRRESSVIVRLPEIPDPAIEPPSGDHVNCVAERLAEIRASEPTPLEPDITIVERSEAGTGVPRPEPSRPVVRVHRVARPLTHPAQAVQTLEREVEAPEDASRTYVDISTDFLRLFYKEHPAIESWQLAQDYVGKWMAVSGTVGGVSSISHSYYITSRDTWNGPLYLYFDVKWELKLLRLKQGERFRAVGRIKDLNVNYITLEKCELMA